MYPLSRARNLRRISHLICDLDLIVPTPSGRGLLTLMDHCPSSFTLPYTAHHLLSPQLLSLAQSYGQSRSGCTSYMPRHTGSAVICTPVTSNLAVVSMTNVPFTEAPSYLRYPEPEHCTHTFCRQRSRDFYSP